VAKRNPLPECSDKQLATLKRWASGEASDARLVLRAGVVLKAAEGLQDKEIAKLMAVTARTSSKWRQRFIGKGLDGLFDDPRPGQPVKHPRDKTLNSIRELLKKPPPPGLAFWNGHAVSKELGISRDTVWIILRGAGIRLERKRRHRSAKDPLRSFKVSYVSGIFLSPSERALVLSHNAVGGVKPVVKEQPAPGKGRPPTGRKDPPRRKTLLAALETSAVPRGKAVLKPERRDALLAFLERVMRRSPDGKEHHVILEGSSVTDALVEWLRTRPNVTPHVAAELVPDPGTWLGAVEQASGALPLKGMKATGFKKGADMHKAIKVFLEEGVYPERTFVWVSR
jgi:transposase